MQLMQTHQFSCVFDLQFAPQGLVFNFHSQRYSEGVYLSQHSFERLVPACQYHWNTSIIIKKKKVSNWEGVFNVHV